MSDLNRAITAEIEAYTPDRVPPLSALTDHKRNRDRRRYSTAGAALSLAAVGAIALGATSLTGAPKASSAGFDSYVGILGCADLVAWGQVTGSQPVKDGLSVELAVEEWVYPEAGAATVTVVADDPAREVGAPTWDASNETVLVIVSNVGPTQRLDAAYGAEVVAQWREAGSPRTPADTCDNA